MLSVRPLALLPTSEASECQGWSDGTLLSWQAPEKQLERHRSQDTEESARRYTSPAVGGTGIRPRIKAAGVAGVAGVAATTRPYSGSPRGRRSGKGISRGTGHPREIPNSARAPKSARSDSEKNPILGPFLLTFFFHVLDVFYGVFMLSGLNEFLILYK